jgi:cytosine deaminase
MDLIIRGARTADAAGRVDIAIRDGRIVRIAARVPDAGGQEIDVGGKLVIPGLVESHFHLDKALLGAGAPADAGSVAGAKGIFKAPGTETLMREALKMGGQVVGGVPYNDIDPLAHLDLVFDLAREFDRDVDLHLDFADDADRLLVGEVADRTVSRGWEGRVVAGHMSALGALMPDDLAPVVARIRDAGISILVLPVTDLYLMGRNDVRNVRRGLAPARRLHDAGVNVAVSTNNVQNPFTPFGDFDLLRIANILATAGHFGTADDLVLVLRMATEHGARALRLPTHGVREGARADLVLLDCTEPAEAVGAIPERLMVMKNGAVVVTNRVETMFMRPPASLG